MDWRDNRIVIDRERWRFKRTKDEVRNERMDERVAVDGVDGGVVETVWNSPSKRTLAGTAIRLRDTTLATREGQRGGCSRRASKWRRCASVCVCVQSVSPTFARLLVCSFVRLRCGARRDQTECSGSSECLAAILVFVLVSSNFTAHVATMLLLYTFTSMYFSPLANIFYIYFIYFNKYIQP